MQSKLCGYPAILRLFRNMTRKGACYILPDQARRSFTPSRLGLRQKNLRHPRLNLGNVRSSIALTTCETPSWLLYSGTGKKRSKGR